MLYSYTMLWLLPPREFKLYWTTIPIQLSCNKWIPIVIISEEDLRRELFDELLNVEFEGQSGTIHFKPGVGDRLPIKLEIVNIHVMIETIIDN